MKTTTLHRLFVLSFLFVSALSLRAQTGSAPVASGLFPVEVGDAFEYEGVVHMEVGVPDPEAGTTKTVRSEGTMVNVLEVGEITDQEIVWEMTGISTMTSDMVQGEARQEPVVMNLITDRQGRLKKITLGEASDGESNSGLLSMMVGSGTKGSAQQGPGWFLPAELSKKEVGESWTATTHDTSTMAIQEGVNVDIVVSVTTTYTYTGTVDTLGVTTARLNWRVVTMQLDGSFAMGGSGINMSISGSGEGTGISYYSLLDKLLFSQTSDMVLEQTVDMSALGVPSMPMTIRMRIDQDRQQD